MGQAAPRLSISIPTHHGRVSTLHQAIRSVLDQAADVEGTLLEICVSDNASHDGTAEMIDRLRARSVVPVRYRRNNRDVGPARNVLAAVEMARGDYCWLLSSDDLLADGAVRRALDLLDSHDGIVGMTVDQVVFSPEDGTEFPEAGFDNKPSFRETCVLDGTELIVAELGLLFSGISLHVFDRRAWTRLAKEHQQAALGGHGLFAHAVILGELARESPRWLWCSEPLVRYRAVPLQVVSRAPGDIDVTTWLPRFLDDLIRALRPHLGEATYRRTIYRYAVHFCRPESILAIRRLPGHGWRQDLFMAQVFFRRLRWIDGFWSETAPALLIPRFALSVPVMVTRASRAAMRACRRLLGRAPLRARVTAAVPSHTVADTVEPIKVRIENRGLPLRTWWPLLPLYVSCRCVGRGTVFDNCAALPGWIHKVIKRNQVRDVWLRVATPPTAGRYELSVGISWGGIWLDELAWSGPIEVRTRTRSLEAAV